MKWTAGRLTGVKCAGAGVMNEAALAAFFVNMLMPTMKLEDLIQRLREIPQQVEAAAEAGLLEAAKVVQEEAKAWIGQEHDNWPPLAASTIEEKARLGYDVPTPLLRDGQLRDSIEISVAGHEAFIGSNLEYAKVHEHGDSHVPPRPFLSSALAVKDKEIGKVIERVIATRLR